MKVIETKVDVTAVKVEKLEVMEAQIQEMVVRVDVLKKGKGG